MCETSDLGYPVVLSMRGRHAVVVGGGAVGERKVRALLRAEARITLISPTATPALAALAEDRRITWRSHRYASCDLPDDAAIVIACTDSRRTNRQVCEDARLRRSDATDWRLVNDASDPTYSDFANVAQIRHDGTLITVSTGGSSPARARSMKQRIAAWLEGRTSSRT